MCSIEKHNQFDSRRRVYFSTFGERNFLIFEKTMLKKIETKTKNVH